jgi:hypothetical protein
VSHREPRLTLHRRDGDGFAVIEARRADSITIDGLAAHLGVDEVYRDELEDTRY